jgi:hypothetical protein
MATLTLLPIITVLMFLYFRRKPTPKSKGDFFQISERVFMTPTGIVDFDAPRTLSIKEEFHNRKCDFEDKQQDREYDYQDAIRKWQQPFKVYDMMKDEVEAIPPIEKLDYIPKWVNYKFEWEKTATEADKKYGHPMPLHCFIACEINPWKSMNMHFPVMRLKKMNIRYVTC